MLATMTVVAHYAFGIMLARDALPRRSRPGRVPAACGAGHRNPGYLIRFALFAAVGYSPSRHAIILVTQTGRSCFHLSPAVFPDVVISSPQQRCAQFARCAVAGRFWFSFIAGRLWCGAGQSYE
jgi:hypothetical protein